MKRTLTLDLDEPVARAAEAHARARGLSVEALVERYLRTLAPVAGDEASAPERPGAAPEGRPGRDRPLPPVVRALVGSGTGEEGDYDRHLAAKHH
jgi:hypothetical protein